MTRFNTSKRITPIANSSKEIEQEIERLKLLADNSKVTLDQAIAIAQLCENRRNTNAFIEDGERSDQNFTAFGEIVQELTGHIEAISDNNNIETIASALRKISEKSISLRVTYAHTDIVSNPLSEIAQNLDLFLEKYAKNSPS
jgi:23S rRNA C2498 (ribose-2'-O)-methylase RlmM